MDMIRSVTIHIDAQVVVHNHNVTNVVDNDEVLGAINDLRSVLMSQLLDAVTRVANAYNALKALLDQALATDAADAAAIQSLTAQRDALQAEHEEAVAALANIAPAPDEPPVTPPDVTPTPDTPPEEPLPEPTPPEQPANPNPNPPDVEVTPDTGGNPNPPEAEPVPEPNPAPNPAPENPPIEGQLP